MPINMRDTQSIRQGNIGVGGVSMDTSGNMNPSVPIQQNPYLENNVMSFANGGQYERQECLLFHRKMRSPRPRRVRRQSLFEAIWRSV